MNNSKTGWWIAGALAIVVVILLAMMWNAWSEQNKDLDNVLKDAQAEITEARDAIAEKCNGPESNDMDCNDALNELKDVLLEFSADVNTASTSGNASGSVSQ